MNISKLNYIISKGKFAQEYLMEQGKINAGTIEGNRIINHALAVSSLIDATVNLYGCVKGMEKKINTLQSKVNDLENEKIEPHLNQFIEIFKSDLIKLITDYPNIEY